MTNHEYAREAINPIRPQPAAPLLPHKPPLLVVENLLQRKGSQTEASATLPATGFFIHSGSVLPEYCIELIAQTAALGNCYDAVTQGKAPRDGMLVGIDAFTWSGQPQAGACVSIKTDLRFAFAAITSIHGQIFAKDTLLAAGDMKVWEALDEAGGNTSVFVSPSPAQLQGGEIDHASVSNVFCPSLESNLSVCCRRLQQTGMENHRLEASAEFCFPSDFVGFQGHFPGNPILPAIVQTAAVRYVAERLLDRPLRPMLLKKIKFKGVVRPGEPLTVDIALNTDGLHWRGTFWLRRGSGEAIASGFVEYE